MVYFSKLYMLFILTSHLNTAVRRCAAQHLSDVVEHMGPGRILSGIKDITDKILSAVAKFVQDGSQETR